MGRGLRKAGHWPKKPRLKGQWDDPANENSEGQVGATNQPRAGLGTGGYKRRLRARELSDQQQEGEERGRWMDGRKKAGGADRRKKAQLEDEDGKKEAASEEDDI